MQEPFSKDRLLELMRNGFAQFESLLAPLSEEQMTTPGVNDAWSVKDNLAHLTVWQWHALKLLQAVKDHVAPVDQYEGMTEDQQNERIYQQNKDRLLSEVQSEFRSSFEQLLAGVQSLTQEELEKPQSWLGERPVWPYVVGNTYGHYDEHTQIIQHWLQRNKTSA
ncbi:MAG TPA: ClbS/DfsB family four-helix bundle protein [Ktedonobacteraceae bacterium]|nr:ClbS/DfsB family four-helix bundle protein [Ktedonobacteraceae bacterium]